ncbi:hypothetical protein J6Q66_02955 [bacterium]|nr:hypothetical protein [bacterium]
MRKIILSILLFSFVSTSFMLCGFSFFKKKEKQTTQIQQEVFSQEKKDTWCITFQLIWNDFMDTLFDSKPVEFVGGNTPLVDELNQRLYSKDLLSENSYYITHDVISKKLKRQIERDIKKKFNEKSDILDMIDWNAKNTLLFYTMLKKDFTFLKAFDKLPNQKFNNSNENVKYFGVTEKSKSDLYKNVQVLFYNNENDFAVTLKTKENEDVILYRTESETSFENLYKEIQEKTHISADFNSKDVLKVPNIDVNKLINYKELSGRKIKNSDYEIGQALQTIKFKLDDKGGTLKSEAAMSVKCTSLAPPMIEKRFFEFDKPFVLFLKETSKEKPYYAMKIQDTKYLVK